MDGGRRPRPAGAFETDVTQLLVDAGAGDKQAADRLFAAVNEELRGIARRHMRRHFGPGLPGVTLQPTGLVNETFLRLVKQRQKYDNRGHFFAIATKVLLRVLIDYERERAAAKRGGGRMRVPLDPEAAPAMGGQPAGEAGGAFPERFVQALEKLEGLDKRKADVVRYRVIWGLSIDETAEALGAGHATIERDWSFARAWLGKELSEDAP